MFSIYLKICLKLVINPLIWEKPVLTMTLCCVVVGLERQSWTVLSRCPWTRCTPRRTCGAGLRGLAWPSMSRQRLTVRGCSNWNPTTRRPKPTWSRLKRYRQIEKNIGNDYIMLLWYNTEASNTPLWH